MPKVIMNLSDNDCKEIMSFFGNNLDNLGVRLRNALKQGIILPDNTQCILAITDKDTNGDVIRTLFSELNNINEYTTGEVCAYNSSDTKQKIETNSVFWHKQFQPTNEKNLKQSVGAFCNKKNAHFCYEDKNKNEIENEKENEK